MSTNQKKITFIIPTCEQTEQLDVCVESIFTASENTSMKISIVILDNYSEKENENKKRIVDIFKSGAGPNIIYKQQKEFVPRNTNLFTALRLAEEERADYYWTISDDDIILPDGIKHIELLLNNEKKYKGLIHACTYSQSEDTNNSIQLSLWNAVNNYGFNEILGLFTSNIYSQEILRKVISLKEWHNVYSRSFFTHAHALLHVAINENIIILDTPIVDNQIHTNKIENQERWKNEGLSSRFFEVSTAVNYQIHNNILPGKVSKTFFRYMGYHLWDKLINEEIKKQVQFKEPYNKEKWKKIQLLAECLSDEYTKNLILSNIADIISNLSKITKGNNYLSQIMKLHNSSVFPFEVWHEDPINVEIMNHGSSERLSGNRTHNIKEVP